MMDCGWCYHGRGVHGETTMDGDVHVCTQCPKCLREAAERRRQEADAE